MVVMVKPDYNYKLTQYLPYPQNADSVTHDPATKPICFIAMIQQKNSMLFSKVLFCHVWICKHSDTGIGPPLHQKYDL